MAEENKITNTEVAAPQATAEAKPADHAGRRPHNGDRNRKPNDRRPRRPMEKKDDLVERVVQINRISKTVKGGRRMRFASLVVVGDGKGKYGFGCGKAQEVPDAIKKSLTVARTNMYNVHIVKGSTIPHEIIGKFGACTVYLKPAPEGTGIIAGGPVRAVLELAGIKNIYSKVYGSRTPINIIRATVDGLTHLKTFESVKELRK